MSLQHIIYVYVLCFVFAIHKSLFSIHAMSKKSDFMCPDKFTKCQVSGFWALLGSPWLATGSYFGKMTPPGPRAFLNRSRTSELNFLYKKHIKNSRYTALAADMLILCKIPLTPIPLWGGLWYNCS